MLDHQRKKLSKFMALILRHEPEKFGLHPGNDGFVPLKDLIKALRSSRIWEKTKEDDIREVVSNCNKGRYEISGDKIRAKWGHSIERTIEHPEVEPPEFLYHGTSRDALDSIFQNGLSEMSRQYVHLSVDRNEAQSVGSRHSAHTVILTIKAQDAWKSGVKFFSHNGKIYLAEKIAPEWLSFS